MGREKDEDDAASIQSGSTAATGQTQISEEKDMPSSTTESSTLRDAVFGVLYTLSREKFAPSRALVIFSIIVDFLQLAVFIYSPAFGWNIGSGNVVWKLLNNVQLNNPVVQVGRTFYIAVFFILSAILLMSAAICAYVAHNFKTNHFPYVWPIKLLRIFVSVFFNTLYISSLNIFLVSVDCYEDAVTGVLMLEAFPNLECGDPFVLVMGIWGGIMSIIFFSIALPMEMAEYETDPLSDNWLARPDSREGVQLFLLKTSMTVLSLLLSRHQKFQGMALLIVCTAMFYISVRYLPYYHEFTNKFRNALYFGLFYMSCILLIKVNVKGDDHTQTLTLVLVFGNVAAFVVGWWITKWAIWRQMLLGRRFLNLPIVVPEEEEQDVYIFKSDRDVQIASVVMREKMKRVHRKLTADPAHVDAGELILLVGLAQHPESAFLHIQYMHFLATVRKDNSKANHHLETARGLKLMMREKFQIFCRDRERMQQGGDGAAAEGDKAMDLVSYVEFQSNLNIALDMHRRALMATRDFWLVLMQQDVHYKKLSMLFNSIEHAESRANRAFRSVLERYPKNPKLLRSYAAFLEEVQNDPVAAKKYLREAERQEEIAAENRKEGGLDDEKDGVVIIDKQGIILMVNKVALELWGYANMDELMAKNVRMLMPPPYSGAHDGYLVEYNRSAKAKVMGTTRTVHALHKEKHTFPISLTLSTVDSNGKVTYMAVVRAVEEDESILFSVEGKTGKLLTSNMAFTTILGYSAADAKGLAAGKVIAEPGAQNERELAAYLEEFVLAPGMRDTLPHVRMCTRGNQFLGATLSVAKVGEGDGRVFLCTMRSLADDAGTMTIDDKGKILAVNKYVADLLGYSRDKLLEMNVNALMPMPYCRFHNGYLTNYVAGHPSGRVVGMPGGRTVQALHASGKTVPIQLSVEEGKPSKASGGGGGKPARTFNARISAVDKAKPDPRQVDMIVNEQTLEVLSVSPACELLLGYKVEDLMGKRISSLLKREDNAEVDDLLELQEAEAGRGKSNRSGWRFHMKVGPGMSSAEQLAKGMRSDEGWEGYFPCSIAINRAGYNPDKDAGGNDLVDVGASEMEGISLKIYPASLLEALIAIDMTGRVTYANADMERMFGRKIAELVGRNVAQIMPKEVAAHHDGYVRNYLNTGVKKLIGTRRTVEARVRCGVPLFVDLELSEVTSPAMLAQAGLQGAAPGTRFIARIVQTLQSSAEQEAEGRQSDAGSSAGGGPTIFAPGVGLNGHGSSHSHGHHGRVIVGAPGIPQLKLPDVGSLVNVDRSSMSGTPDTTTTGAVTARNVDVGFLDEGGGTASSSVTGGSAYGGGNGYGQPHSGHGPPGRRNSMESIASSADSDSPLVRMRELDSAHPHHSGAPSAKETFWSMAKANLRKKTEAIVPGMLSSSVSRPVWVDEVASSAKKRAGTPPLVKKGAAGSHPFSSLAVPDDDGASDTESTGTPGTPDMRRSLLATKERRGSAHRAQVLISGGGENVAHKQSKVPFGIEAFLNDQVAAPAPPTEAHDEGDDSLPVSSPAGLVMSGGEPRSALTAKGGKERREPTDRKQPVRFDDDEEDPAAGMSTRGGAMGATGRSGADGGDGKRTAGVDDAEDENALSARRSRRYKRLVRLLGGWGVLRAAQRARLHSRLVLWSLLLAHVVLFAATRYFVRRHKALIQHTDAAGTATGYAAEVLVDARTMDVVGFGGAAAAYSYYRSHNASAFMAATNDHMMSILDVFESTLEWLFLVYSDVGGAPSEDSLAHLFSTPSLDLVDFQDTDPPRLVPFQMGLWDASRRLIADGRKLALASDEDKSLGLTHDRSWRYLIDNGRTVIIPALERAQELQLMRTIDSQEALLKLFAVVFAIEAGVIVLFAILHLVRLIAAIGDERLRTFSIFLYVPRPLLRMLASKNLSVGEEALGDADAGAQGTVGTNDSDEMAPGGGGDADESSRAAFFASTPRGTDSPRGTGTLGKKRGSAFSRLRPRALASMMFVPAVVASKKRRQLIADGMGTVRYLLPCVGFLLLSCMGFAITYFVMARSLDPLHDIDAARMEIYLSTRVIYDTQELVVAAQREPTSPNVAARRRDLADTAEWHMRYHKGLLFGDPTLGLTGSLYHGAGIEQLQFGVNQCLRRVKSLCWNASNDYYVTTQSGVDALTHAFTKYAKVLALDSVADLSPDVSGRFHYIWDVGHADLRDGLTALADKYIESAMSGIAIDNIVASSVFAVIVVSLWLYNYYMLRPLVAIARKESDRVAELLSQLPATLNLDTIITEVSRRQLVFDGSFFSFRSKALIVDGRSLQAASKDPSDTPPLADLDMKEMLPNTPKAPSRIEKVGGFFNKVMNDYLI